MHKTKFLSIRVDPKAYKVINRMAYQEGVTVSDLVRDRLLKPGDDQKDKDKAGEK